MHRETDTLGPLGPKREKGFAMTPHTAVPMSYAHERYLGRPSCPKCGELIMAPDFSEYLKNEASIRHWSCDGCEYEFKTLIKLPKR